MNIIDPLDLDLKNTEPEELDGILMKIERSYKIRFTKAELRHVETFGELCDIIMKKMHYADAHDCTSQQAFYKIRNAIIVATLRDRNSITLRSSLEDLFPKDGRRKAVRSFERELGFNVPLLLTIKNGAVTFILICLFFTSFIVLYFNIGIGLIAIVLIVAAFYLTAMFANEFGYGSVEDLVNKIVRENYVQIRRDPDSVNRNEVLKNIKALFSHELSINESKLHREATFN